MPIICSVSLPTVYRARIPQAGLKFELKRIEPLTRNKTILLFGLEGMEKTLPDYFVT